MEKFGGGSGGGGDCPIRSLLLLEKEKWWKISFIRLDKEKQWNTIHLYEIKISCEKNSVTFILDREKLEKIII